MDFLRVNPSGAYNFEVVPRFGKMFSVAQNSDRWRALVNAVMNISVSIKCGESLDYLKTC